MIHPHDSWRVVTIIGPQAAVPEPRATRTAILRRAFAGCAPHVARKLLLASDMNINSMVRGLGSVAVVALVVGGLTACGTEGQSEIQEVETASPTTPSGIVSVETFSRTRITDMKFEYRWHGQYAEVKPEADLVVQRITFAPGAQFGWHSHPGPAVVNVVSGTLTYYAGIDPCTPVPYAAGNSFLDQGGGFVHNARNEGADNLVITVFYTLPVGAAARIDHPAPAGACF
jgi:quercetin dioxygenase-like cupin family protein